MSYCEALKAAGAEVLDFQEFGSYQGDWWAKVVYNGQTGFVNGDYGSCSGCDSYEAEIGYERDKCGEHYYMYDPIDCKKCSEKKLQSEAKLADFGRRYLDNVMTKEEAMNSIQSWQSDSCDQIRWLMNL